MNLSLTRQLGRLPRAAAAAALVAAIAATPAGAQSRLADAAATPLSALVAEALQNNPELRAAAKETEAANQRVRPAGALEDPREPVCAGRQEVRATRGQRPGNGRVECRAEHDEDEQRQAAAPGKQAKPGAAEQRSVTAVARNLSCHATGTPCPGPSRWRRRQPDPASPGAGGCTPPPCSG